MGYQRLSEYQIGLPLFKVNEPQNCKCHHFASVQVKQIVNMAHFVLCFTCTDVNEDIWNFQGSLTLSEGKLI